MSSSAPSTRRGKAIVLAAVLGMTLGMTGVADAALVYSNTTRLYACVNKTTKAVRIVTPRNGHTACRSTERVVSWA
jgi:hypothetical protein